MSAAAPVALVSGGSRGLGAALVGELLGRGWRVAAFSRNGSAAVEQWRRADPDAQRFVFAALDAADHAAARGFVQEVARRFGRLDALINNAAVAAAGVLPLLRPGQIHELIAVNLEAALLLAQSCARVMLAQGSGAIVNVSSIAGQRGFAGLAAYGATKAALDGLTRGLARELGPRGIRVNSVAPGYLDTEMSRELGEEDRERIRRRTPLGRLARSEDVVAAVRFLISAEAAFITGQTLVVDGGLTC